MDARETVRRALVYAIQDREEYMRCIQHTDDQYMKERTQMEIRKFKMMLKRRYPEYCEPEEAGIVHLEWSNHRTAPKDPAPK